MNRRNLIKNISAGVILPNILPGFSMNAFAASPLMESKLAATVTSEKILVLVRLDGGNDGLNTVIPLDKYADLYAERSNIIVPQNQVLSITGNNTIGLHPSLTGIRSLYNEGKIKIIQGVAYPNQTQSHFRSSDVWMSAADENTYVGSGFAGRYLDFKYQNYPVGYPNTDMPDPLGIEIASGKSLMFEGRGFGNSIPITNTNAFYNLVNGIETPTPNNTGGEQLGYIRTIQRQSNAYSSVIVNAANSVTSQLTYPQTDIAQSLKIVAKLIGGGLRTKIYMVSLGGFDTHGNQSTDHPVLLSELSQALKVFMDDIAQLGAANNVLGMTFSEFGRRISSNGSDGTDHGEAAPMFMFGHKVAGGVFGTTPNIVADVANNYGNVTMQFDFRSIYTTILKDWFCVPTNDLPTIMLNSFNALPIIQANATCAFTLPVNLLLFTVRLVGENASFLQWKTSEEVNFSHFELEHSIDGVNFVFVQTIVKKLGNDQVKNYDFIHRQTAIGNNFYRLKIVDQDAGYKYSSIVQVTITQKLQSISIYPNPVITSFNIKHSTTITVIHIIAANGAVVKKMNYADNAVIDVQDVRPGNYVLQCFNKSELVAVAKFAKL
jgi:uncharacterized protein (DUF1501 family)